MFKKLSFKVMLAGGNAIILSLMILISSILYFSINSLINASKWVAHTHNVLERCSLLAKSMVDMETGQRGFMLTGNDAFLAPYNSGQEMFKKEIEYAKKLVSDNPEQVKRFERVEELKGQWVSQAGQYEIDLKRRVDKGELPDVALANVLQGKKTKPQVGQGFYG